jgi:hypothetical protein
MIAVNELSLALVKAKQDVKKQKKAARTRDKTPRAEKKEILVIGSSSTWKLDELKHFNVKIEKDVDVTKMIPQRYFAFDHLERYARCLFPRRNSLIVGKEQLCAMSDKDVKNERVVNRIENNSFMVFVSLLQLFQVQSDLGHANITRKRQEILDVSVSMDIPQTAQISLGTYLVTVSNHRHLHLSNGNQSSQLPIKTQNTCPVKLPCP